VGAKLGKRPIGDVVDSLAVAKTIASDLLIAVHRCAEVEVRQAVYGENAVVRARAWSAETDALVLTRRRKQLVGKSEFVCEYYGLVKPAVTIRPIAGPTDAFGRERFALISCKTAL